MKFGGIVGEVKISNKFDTGGATYSLTENTSQNVLEIVKFIISKSYSAGHTKFIGIMYHVWN